MIAVWIRNLCLCPLVIEVSGMSSLDKMLTDDLIKEDDAGIGSAMF